MKTLLSSLVIAVALGLSVARAETPAPSGDEQAIRANVQASVAAFNRHDAKAIAAFWSPEAVYTSRTSGDKVVGREAIEKEYEELFKVAKNARLAVTVDSIDFVSPNVAMERGTAKIVRDGVAPEETDYSAVHVKRDGKWLLDRVTEEEVPVVQSHYQQLKELEWTIGSWVDEDKDDDAQIVTECQWTKNQNFITRAFKVTIGDRIHTSGMQLIGWDPAAKQIRSWVFDSDGGFGEAVWRRKGNRWYIKQTGVLPDGRHSSSTNIMTRIDNNSFTWQSVDREVDGEIQPNVDEIKIVREVAH